MKKQQLFSLLLISIYSIILSSCTTPHRSPSSDVKHLVFDIDWTIVKELRDENIKPSNLSRMITVEGKNYFINDGLEDFIIHVLSKPDMKISFYSGGKDTRNIELLSKIKLPDGRSLKDIAFKVLDYDDLVRVENIPESAPFAERLKKDLSKISHDLKNVILLDDTDNFFLDSIIGERHQRQSFSFIGKAFLFFDNYHQTKDHAGDYVPKSFDSWLLDRKKLSVLKEAFEVAYQETLEGTISFSEAMKKQEELLNLKSFEWNEWSKRYFNFAFKKETLFVKKKINGNFCLESMNAFF